MMPKMKSGGGVKAKMNVGGMADPRMTGPDMTDPRAVQALLAASRGGAGGYGMKKGGMATSKMGAAKTAAPSKDGVAVKGKTKGTQIKMAGGGMMKKKMMKSGGY